MSQSFQFAWLDLALTTSLGAITLLVEFDLVKYLTNLDQVCCHGGLETVFMMTVERRHDDSQICLTSRCL